MEAGKGNGSPSREDPAALLHSPLHLSCCYARRRLAVSNTGSNCIPICTMNRSLLHFPSIPSPTFLNVSSALCSSSSPFLFSSLFLDSPSLPSFTVIPPVWRNLFHLPRVIAQEPVLISQNSNTASLPTTFECSFPPPSMEAEVDQLAYNVSELFEEINKIKVMSEQALLHLRILQNHFNERQPSLSILEKKSSSYSFPFAPLSFPLLSFPPLTIDTIDSYCDRLPSLPQRFFPFWANFMAGSLALPFSFALVHPIDVVKTRMQVGGGANAIGFFSQMSSSLRHAST